MIRILYRSLKRTRNLLSLDLDFTAYPKIATDRTLSWISKLFSKLQLLQKISVNLNSCLVSLQGTFIKLFHSLNSSVKLTVLSLILISTFVTDEDAFTLSDSLKKMSHLEFLTLDFSMCQKIGNSGISKIFEDLARLTQLRKLRVSLNRCNSDVQASFPILFKNLKNLENIHDLNLDFTGNYLITDQSFSFLDITFFKMKKIQTLHLELFGCKLSNTALENLGASMNRLQTLENLCLSLGL